MTNSLSQTRKLCICVIHCIVASILQMNTSAQLWSIVDIIPKTYDPKKSPNPRGVTKVNISVIVNDLLSVTESDSSFQLDLTLKLKWYDQRLNLSSGIQNDILDHNNTIDNIILDSSYISKFWIPDIYFQNALSVSIVNSGLSVQYLVIGIDKNITYTVRYSGKFICKMDLTNYPQDYQFCSIEAVSLTQTSSQLLMQWEDFVSGYSNYPKFRIRSIYTDSCVRTSYVGNFSCMRGTLKLVRRVSYYVIRVYAPTFLSVIIAFVGFWIPILGWPARVTIIVTPLLNLITLDISLNNEINVSYVVAIHWWMIWCQIFVFLALFEYALAISWAHFINDKKAFKTAIISQKDLNMNLLNGHYFGNNNYFAKCGKIVDKLLIFFFGVVDYHKDPMTRNKVDYCSRLIFPFLWILYCLIYILVTICPWAANYNL
ncbi:glycine receptor subunit alpha-2-like [Oppia nitens]|uniref:glycine receptor subunit alpha-2-like n=1 Tax=Oppia nitens TaxID=1686743 RepID=UPI0023DCCFC9|nr:glycine receptor subunit alpha-2-like [Oppia nitens]